MRLKRAIIVAMAAAMAGCGGERTERPAGESSAIGFSTPMLETRGTAVTTPALLASAGGFGVWAYSHEGEWGDNNTRTALIDGQTVTSDDGGQTWTYENPVRWPMDSHNVSFFAYAPVGSGTITHDTDSTPQIEYAVAATAANQKDLLFADDIYDQHGSDYYPLSRKVNLNFRHALSQIGFAACYVGTKAEEVQVAQIVLKNVYDKGSSPLKTDPIAWTLDDSSTANYTLTAGKELTAGLLDENPTDIMAAGGLLYLMPQSVNDHAAGVMEIEVTFDIDGGPLTYSTPILLPEVWLAGKSYQYQITLDDNAIQVIVIDSAIDLDAWEGSIALQTVMLSSEPDRDMDNIFHALTVLNSINTLTAGTYYYPYFGIYGVNDVNHDISIDIGAYMLYLDNFKEDQCLLFDFKKSIRSWGTNAEDGDRPWEIAVTGYTDYWTLAPSQQNLPPDAASGATITNPSPSINMRGSIILQRNDTPIP